MSAFACLKADLPTRAEMRTACRSAWDRIGLNSFGHAEVTLKAGKSS
ncbi:MAG: hypothetical protein O3A63_13675 [Proteobacteria bacterium]|nr:hypothetical protein [Pseudomonadota bacterium]